MNENKNSLWQKFVTTGSVKDYLAYTQKKDIQNESNQKEQKNSSRRHSNKNDKS